MRFDHSSAFLISPYKSLNVNLTVVVEYAIQRRVFNVLGARKNSKVINQTVDCEVGSRSSMRNDKYILHTDDKK